MPALAFAARAPISLRYTTSRRAYRASIVVRATHEVRVWGLPRAPAGGGGGRAPDNRLRLGARDTLATPAPLPQESLAEKAKGALNSAKEAVR